MELKNIEWTRVNHGIIDIPLLDYLEKIIDEQHELGRKVKICVGTDSQRKGRNFKFVTVILIEMKEPMGLVNGKMEYKGLGAKVISGSFYDTQKRTIKERMLKEVQLSIDVCYHILDLVELYEVDMEIHVDINPNPRWASNVAFTEAIGYCKGMNFNYKVKPDAYAASSSADKICHGG